MFPIVFGQVLIMFLLMLIGFVYAKFTKMSSEESGRICNILLMIVTPCLLINNLQRPFSRDGLNELVFSFVLAVAASAISVIVACLFFLRRGTGSERRIQNYAASFGNVGFIGIPLISGIFGEKYVVFAVGFVVVFHLLSWTVGVALLKGSGEKLSWKEAFLNPGVLSAVVAVPLFLFNITLPAPIGPVVGYISSLNTPLAMLVCGFFIAGVNVKKLKGAKILMPVAVRLLVIPLVTMGVYYLFRVDRLVPDGGMLVLVNLVSAACPSAIATSMMAARYKLDGEYASLIVAASTVACLITLPAVTMLGQWLFL